MPYHVYNKLNADDLYFRFRKRIRGYVLLISNGFGFGLIGRFGFRVGALYIFSQVVRRPAKEVSAKVELKSILWTLLVQVTTFGVTSHWAITLCVIVHMCLVR